MRKTSHVSSVLLSFCFLLSGCATLPGGTAQSKAEQTDLYTKVPAAMRSPVNEAEHDLKQAQAGVALAKEKVKLAEMVKQRADLENQYANCAMNLAEIGEKKCSLIVEVKKSEAIDNANLGDKEANIKKVAALKRQELAIESDRVEVKADLDTLDLKIKKLSKEIEAQEKKIKK